MWELLKIIISAALGFAGAWWWFHLDQKSHKVDLFTGSKSTCTKLQNEYEQLINDKINLEFIAIAQRKSWPKGPIPTIEEVKKSLDQHIQKANDYRDGLQQELDKIGFYFDISEDQKQIIIGLIKIHPIIIRSMKLPSVDGLFIRRPNEISDYDDLKKWRQQAKEQGKRQLEKGFIQPYYKLFKELKKQIA